MPAISKIRFTNVIYENGNKRYNDDIFQFDGYNGALILENGGGKTVFVQTALQAVIPHYDMEDRKIRETLSLEGTPCHIAIEWILNERPRKYLVTAVSLFVKNNRLESYRYTYEYGFDDDHSIEKIPFVKELANGGKGQVGRDDIYAYYKYMQDQNMTAKTFKTIKEYQQYIEENYKIIPSEWKSIGRINSVEGGVERYFDECRTTSQLVERLLIPVVEEAISEDATKDFVKTFEEQRERFKKHRQLREVIEESKQIEGKINGYVSIFDSYHKAGEDYLQKKQYAKAIYIHIEDEKNNIENQINQNKLDRDHIENLRRSLVQKEESYEIAILEDKANKYNLELDGCKKIYSQVKEDFDSKSTRLNNLKIAKLKDEIKREEEVIESHKRQIEMLKSDRDIGDIQDRIDENSSMLRGYFTIQEEDLKKKIERLEIEQGAVKGEYENEKAKLDGLRADKVGVEGDINSKKGQVIEIEKSLRTTRAKIFDLDEHDDIKTKQEAWQLEVGQLEAAMAEDTTRVRHLQIERANINDELAHQRDGFVSLKEERVSIKNKIDSLNRRHEDLLAEVKFLNESWAFIDSLYTRQDSIVAYMEDKLENLRNQKEDLLLRERISGRFKDDYEQNTYFTPEPMVERWMPSWKNQFKYIETGTEYIQRASRALGITEAEFLNNNPYWALSIIVNDQEVDILKERLTRDMDKITSPILILGEGEALKIIKDNKTIDEDLILPKYWLENINQEFFEDWKLDISQKFDEITKERRHKETEIGSYEGILKALRDFFEEYPYEYYQNLKGQGASIEEACYKAEKSIRDRETRLNVIEEEIGMRANHIKDNGTKLDVLNQWIGFARDYIIKERDRDNISYNINQLGDKLQKLNVQIDIIGKDLDIKTDRLKGLSDDINELTRDLDGLRDHHLYREVKDADPTFTASSIYSLEEERKNLKDSLNEKEGNIGSYYDLIDRSTRDIEGKENELDRTRRQSRYPIDEEIEFSFFIEKEIDGLIDGINEIEVSKNKAEKNLRSAEDKYKRQIERCGLLKEQFSKKYEEIIIFNDSLHNIKIIIEKENEDLIKREKGNNETYIRLVKEKEAIDPCLESLKTKDGRYEYLAESIEPIYLEEDFYRDFPYNRKNFVDKILEDLEDLRQDLQEVSSKLEDEKNEFISFCNSEIKDPRLKERTISGVGYKTNYDEILQWQARMKTSIERTIKVAEDDIRQHDKDLQQFIGHISTYLRTLTDELSIIPKKTRIKIDDKWKDVYQFNVPEWKEEEGKEGLRKHIDWMIKQLENKDFKNEDGTENTTSIRREIEKWLDSKQLLAIILNNNPIRVSCRKVTNDGKISSGLNTWEASNRWSGGEKWSKNMTLFLGILNYVAEKRQGLIPGLRSNRSVIVDNPFGKASSDHVLDPVFLIAEKLGFQIIALTAHAEGSYIRNYFPIVYSLRLRPAINSDNLIIDKEEEIQHAFFKDKDPDSLNRLQEKKQLSLFG